MKTKFITIFFLSIVMGGIYCKKENEDLKKIGLWSLLDLFNQGFLEVRFEDQLFQKKVKDLRTGSYDSDSYAEKYLTPDAVEICLPNIMSWEEGEETTLENAERIYGGTTIEDGNACGYIGRIQVSREKPVYIRRFVLPQTDKKREKLGIHGAFFVVYHFKEENFIDKNYKHIQVSYSVDGNNELQTRVRLLVEYEPIIKNEYYINNLLYEDERIGDNILDSVIIDLSTGGDYGASLFKYIYYLPAFSFFREIDERDEYCRRNQNITNRYCWANVLSDEMNWEI